MKSKKKIPALAGILILSSLFLNSCTDSWTQDTAHARKDVQKYEKDSLTKKQWEGQRASVQYNTTSRAS